VVLVDGGTTTAYDFSGGGETVWGAGMGFDLNDRTAMPGDTAPFNQCDAGVIYNLSVGPVPQPFDASAYAGITFWARGSGQETVFVQFPERRTDPWGGVCDPCAGPGPNSCYDDFEQPIVLTPNWTEYNVLFSDVGTANWSGENLRSLDTTAIYAVRFELLTPPGLALPQFELEVMNVSFESLLP
jgi:hypothetical protein